MTSLDTSARAAAVQLAIHRRMSGIERLKLAMEMSDAAMSLALARLRAAFPEKTEIELRHEFLRNSLPPGSTFAARR